MGCSRDLYLENTLIFFFMRGARPPKPKLGSALGYGSNSRIPALRSGVGLCLAVPSQQNKANPTRTEIIGLHTQEILVVYFHA
ncbi:hypothetical protein HanPI659440_Chr17g0682821 [Helianthus annuus]|nr:hypothetical protein HanPI659440_Chr17g0682821 [Helianthus annuus]